jgi:hypothetical protein
MTARWMDWGEAAFLLFGFALIGFILAVAL